MSNDPNNPYAPSGSAAGQDPYAINVAEAGDELAGRGTRFAAAFLDGLLAIAIIIPIQIFSGFTERATAQQVTPIETVLMSLVGLVVFLVLHGYLLVTRGQTIGKLACQIQIVDYATGNLLPAG